MSHLMVVLTYRSQGNIGTPMCQEPGSVLVIYCCVTNYLRIIMTQNSKHVLLHTAPEGQESGVGSSAGSFWLRVSHKAKVKWKLGPQALLEAQLTRSPTGLRTPPYQRLPVCPLGTAAGFPQSGTTTVSFGS